MFLFLYIVQRKVKFEFSDVRCNTRYTLLFFIYKFTASTMYK